MFPIPSFLGPISLSFNELADNSKELKIVHKYLEMSTAPISQVIKLFYNLYVKF